MNINEEIDHKGKRRKEIKSKIVIIHILDGLF